MPSRRALDAPAETTEAGILVRYWAAARSAAGLAEESFPAPATLGELRAAAIAAHPDADRLPAVLAVCSVLVDGRQPDPAAGPLAAGSVVEFLPPFAGG